MLEAAFTGRGSDDCCANPTSMLLAICTHDSCAFELSCAGLLDAEPKASITTNTDAEEKSVCADAVRLRVEMMVSRIYFACPLNSACCEALELAVVTDSSVLT